MSHFYGKLVGKDKEPQIITGTPDSGIFAEVMGAKGKIYIHVHNVGGVDYFQVFLENSDLDSNTKKTSEILARGVLDSTWTVSGGACTFPPDVPSLQQNE